MQTSGSSDGYEPMFKNLSQIHMIYRLAQNAHFFVFYKSLFCGLLCCNIDIYTLGIIRSGYNVVVSVKMPLIKTLVNIRNTEEAVVGSQYMYSPRLSYRPKPIGLLLV